MQPLVLLCFVLSGISSLTLEIVWTRMLELVFGATTLAISTVLTCFMGGLALGSWLFGRFADRVRSPLAFYAVAEGVVGVCALVIPELIEHFYPGLNRALVAHAGNSFWLFSVLRFFAVAAVLIVPTTCMGATLPLLSRHFVSAQGHLMRVGSRVGTLYTLNTAGAILGVFLSTFVLLPGAGLAATNRVAGFLNLTLAALILAFRKALAPSSPCAEATDDVDPDTGAASDGARPFDPTRPERTAALAAFFVTGLSAMSLQVVWNRAMSMVIGASVYSFALTLLAFLVGLAGGAAAFTGPAKRARNPVILLACVELFVAAAAMANHLYMDDLPRLFALAVTSWVPSPEDHVELVQLVMFCMAALAVLPACLGMGATFPLTVRIAAKSLRRVGRDVGSLYALNTLGAICGSFLSAFVFVPLFSRHLSGAGMQATFFLSVALYALAGMGLLAVARGRRSTRLVGGIAAAAVTAVFILAAPPWNPVSLTAGVFRMSIMRHVLDDAMRGDSDVRYYHDGVSTTVTVEAWGRHFALKNNGKVEASNSDDMPTQIAAASYPLLLHPAGPKDLDVAIIGFGSGVTVGAALSFPVRHVDVVELENAVVEASKLFGRAQGEKSGSTLDVNHLVYRGPDDPALDRGDPETFVIDDRLDVISNDGRNFLTSTARKYDVIVSEPSNPWITGVANLFTADHFRAVSRALAPGGIFCQWVQLYELAPENIRTVFRTFGSVFPHVAVFAAEGISSDTMLLGSFSPVELDYGRVSRAMEDPRTRAELERAGIHLASDALARVLLVDRAELEDYTDGPGRPEGDARPINTDDNALIEFAAPHDLVSYRRFEGYLADVYTSKWPYGRAFGAVRGLGEGREKAVHMADMALALLANARRKEATAFLDAARKLAADDPAVIAASRVATLLDGQGGPPALEVEPPSPSPLLSDADAADLARAVSGVASLVAAGNGRRALERFARIPEHEWRLGGPQMLLLKGYLHFLNADPEDIAQCRNSIEAMNELVREHGEYAATHPEIHFYLSLCHDNALHSDRAVASMRTYIRLSDEREVRERQDVLRDKAALDAALQGLGGR
ncbi:MAG: fused MFS/spermidine synthase [Deltaproteobacteria bacterium]|nr:fused MFS/spermidine synthase [Deltaproteobacteria bacterium]